MQRPQQFTPRNETAALHNLFNFRVPFDFMRSAPVGKAIEISKDQIAGWNEMQGYPDGYGTYEETVGAFLARTGQMPGGIRPPAPFAARSPMAMLRPGQNLGRPPAPMLNPLSVQAGQSQPGTLLSYMGLGSHVFEAAAATTTSFDVEPQSAFRGRRLIIAQAKSSGAVGILVLVTTALTVSGMPQTPNPSQPAPVEMFSPDATYSMLDLQIATSGTSITLGVGLTAAPGSGETVAVSAGLYGEWIR